MEKRRTTNNDPHNTTETTNDRTTRINILLTSPEHMSSLPFLVGYDKLIIAYYHLFIPPEYLRSPPVFSDVRVVRSLVVSVVLCGSLFVVLLF
jgi:hypothetical protein